MGPEARELLPDAYDGDEYSGRSVLPQPPGVRRFVNPGGGHCGRGSARGSGPGCEGAAGGMEC